MASSAKPELTDVQMLCLIDCLALEQCRTEMRNLADPNTIANAGAPFGPRSTPAPLNPILSLIFRNSVMKLPGLDTAPLSLWQQQCQNMLASLAGAQLSDSFDRGAITKRVLISQALSVVCACFMRWTSGINPVWAHTPKIAQDGSIPTEDMFNDPIAMRLAWDKMVHGLLHGNFRAELTDVLRKTPRLQDMPMETRLAHRYALHILANALYYICSVSPPGQSFVAVVRRIHEKVPYFVMRQALKVCNASTMYTTMGKLLLMKPGSWFGSKRTLLQRHHASVIEQECSEFERKVERLKKQLGESSEPAQIALQGYVDRADPKEREACRQDAIEQKISIVCVILRRAHVAEPDEQQHKLFLEMFVAMCTTRDRRELLKIICDGQPDYYTAMFKNIWANTATLVGQVHETLNLTQVTEDVELMLTELLEVTEQPNVTPASYFNFLLRHVDAIQRVAYEMNQNPELADAYWKTFYDLMELHKLRDNNGHDIKSYMQQTFSKLSASDQNSILQELRNYQEQWLEPAEKESAEAMAGQVRDADVSVISGVYLKEVDYALRNKLVTNTKAKGAPAAGRFSWLQTEESIKAQQQYVTHAIHPSMTTTKQLLQAPYAAYYASFDQHL